MSKIIATTYDTKNHRAYITYALLAVSVCMMMIYIFDIYKVIATSVSVSKAEAQVSLLESSVQELDSEYIKLSNRITPELVHKHGMSEGTITSYISRTNSLGVVSLGG